MEATILVPLATPYSTRSYLTPDCQSSRPRVSNKKNESPP